MKALVGGRALPAMGDLGDVSEFLTKSGYGSVSGIPQFPPVMLEERLADV